jgi:hypothetical protein
VIPTAVCTVFLLKQGQQLFDFQIIHLADISRKIEKKDMLGGHYGTGENHQNQKKDPK